MSLAVILTMLMMVNGVSTPTAKAAPKIESNSVAYLVFYDFVRALEMSIKNEDILIEKLTVRQKFQQIIFEKNAALVASQAVSIEEYEGSEWALERTKLQLGIATQFREYLDASRQANVFQTQFARALPADMRQMFDSYTKLWDADCEAKRLREELARIDAEYRAGLERRALALAPVGAISEEESMLRQRNKKNADVNKLIAKRTHADCTEGIVTWEWVSSIGQ